MKKLPLAAMGALVWVSCLAKSGAQTTIMSDHFYSAADLTNWSIVVDGTTQPLINTYLTATNIVAATGSNAQTVPIWDGTGTLLLKLGTGATQTRVFRSPSYSVTTGPTRVKVTANVRVENIAAGDVSIGIQEKDAMGGQSWMAGGTDLNAPGNVSCDFLRLVPSTNWRSFSKIGEIKSTTTSLSVSVTVKNNANTTGKVYLEDLAIVTTSGTDNDYLLEAYCGNQGNVISGTSGTLKVNLYDSRPPVGSVTFTVKNEAGTAISPQPTVTFANGFYSVPLSGKGYYSVGVTGNHMSGTFAYSFPVGVLDPAAPAAGSPYGFFAVNTTNSQAYLGGGNWNRFFINTLSIRQTNGDFWSGTQLNAEGSPCPPEFIFLPANQKWEACLGGVPAFMANVPSGSYVPGKLYPPTDWNQFKDMVKYVAKKLPASVQSLEVANEPEWNWAGNAATKAVDMEMYFKTVHDAIADLRTAGQLANPNLKIIGPSFAHFYSPVSNYNDGMVTLQNSLFSGTLFAGDTGLLTYVDEISMHGYNDSIGSQVPEAQFYDRIYQWVNYERNTAKPPGLTTDGTLTGPLKPIHMTEYGLEVGAGSGMVTELNRAAYTSRAMIMTKAMAWRGIALGIPFKCLDSYCLRWVAQGVPHPEWSMLGTPVGTDFRNDYSATPTYVAYSTAAKILDDADQAGPYNNNVPALPNDAGSNYQMTTFRNGTTLESVTCLWNSGTASLSVRLPSTVTFTATDAMGRAMTVTGNQLLTLSGFPVYLKAASSYGFYVSGQYGTITVAHNTILPGIAAQDALAPSTFILNVGSGSLTSPATPGTYNIMVKVAGLWRFYKVVVT